MNYIWLAYMTVACIMLILFVTRRISFHLTNKHGSEEYIPNWIYNILIILFSIAWPIAYIYIIRDMEE